MNKENFLGTNLSCVYSKENTRLHRFHNRSNSITTLSLSILTSFYKNAAEAQKNQILTTCLKTQLESKKELLVSIYLANGTGNRYSISSFHN